MLSQQLPGLQMPLYYNEESKRYIKLSYYQYNVDYLISEFEEVPYTARQCTMEQDFNQNNYTRSKFKAYNDAGYSLICPDQPENKKPLTILGDSSDEIQKNFEFRVSMCKNDTRLKGEPVCANETEIRNFIKSIQVQ